MFPIVHHYANKCLNEKLHPFLIYGGLFPDLASSVGMERDFAHEMGGDFYLWCLEKAPDSLALARGVICHGLKPPGLDYYADEYWPGGEKGWCFQQGRFWLEQVKKATGLPDNLIWWKAHNFIEMALELLVLEENPGLHLEILAALEDQAALDEACGLLAAYSGADAAMLYKIFGQANNIFALDSVNPFTLAQKQAIAFAVRYNFMSPDTPAMAALLCEMREDLRPHYRSFLDLAIARVGDALNALPLPVK